MARGRNNSWQHDLVNSLEASGLTGRGGGAFPTSVKLALARSAGAGGTIVVNGMEGEPASDKDQLLLTRAPHLVLDGAQYLAGLCRADRVVICTPVGRDGVAAAVSHALAERRRHRYAKVKEEIVRPPDRFIAGEESALVNWIDSGRSLPVFRPDKGTPLRIGRRPALVQNTETLAHVALIARRGPGAFRARGMAEEPGTCLITISGSVSRPGVVEVDRGTPLWDIANLSKPIEPTQALLVGGYGGTWVGPSTSTRPTPPFRCERLAPRQESGSSWCWARRRAAWLSRRGSPAIWLTRVPASADRVSTDSPPSLTISPEWPGVTWAMATSQARPTPA